MGMLTLTPAVVIAQRTVTHLLTVLNASGWSVSRIDDGMADDMLISSNAEVLPVVFAVPHADIYFHNGSREHCVHLTPNAGADVISDWTTAPQDADRFGAIVAGVIDSEGF